MKKKKQTKADFVRSWNVPENLAKRGTDWLRYKNPPEKGIYWYWFSLFVRERDVKQWGTCISCDRPITVETSDAGHFMPARDCGRDLLFDPLNVNAECPSCNAWDETHLLSYAEGLDRRYGTDTARQLRVRRDLYSMGPPIKDWKGSEYGEKIKLLPNYPQAFISSLDVGVPR